jgi:hypothetical protein
MYIYFEDISGDHKSWRVHRPAFLSREYSPGFNKVVDGPGVTPLPAGFPPFSPDESLFGMGAGGRKWGDQGGSWLVERPC